MKKLLLSFFLLGTLGLHAQDVDLKKDKVIVDGKELFKFEKINGWHFTFYDFQGNEIWMYKYQNNQTQNYEGDDYFTIHFLTLKRKFQSSDFGLIAAMSPKKNMQKLIKLLFKEKVFDMDGNPDTERLEVFFEKYHQEIK